MLRQRIRQFAHASRTPVEADFALAREFLAPALFELFAAQHPRDIVHSAGTARWLMERGHVDRDLVAAALLHDIGKGHQRRRDRVAHVLIGQYIASAGGEQSRLEMRRAMYRSRTHSAAGARLLEAAGAPARVVDLTCLHHSQPGGDAMLELLQTADAAN